MTPMTPNLKRLAFVESAAVTSLSYVADSSAFAKACGYYTSAKETHALGLKVSGNGAARDATATTPRLVVFPRMCSAIPARMFPAPI